MHPPPFPAYLPSLAGLADALAKQQATQVGLVWDANVYRLWRGKLPATLETLPSLELPAGEAFKHLGTVERTWQWLFENHFDRGSLLVAIGGGVVCDMAAFAASAWLRGIQHVLLPTTLLAMVDAAYGGKTGVDYRGGKNLIGTFKAPAAIWVHPGFQSTQSARELRAGRAEMFKHALIADAGQLEQLAGSMPLDWPAIERSLRIKAQLVETDPTEQGPRKALNLGHTLGHALESARLLGPAPLLHGEAVAVGLALAAKLSVKHAGLPPEEAERVERILLASGYDLALGHATNEILLARAMHDKKNRSGELLFVLLESLGKPVIDIAISPEAVSEALTSHREAYG